MKIDLTKKELNTIISLLVDKTYDWNDLKKCTKDEKQKKFYREMGNYTNSLCQKLHNEINNEVKK